MDIYSKFDVIVSDSGGAGREGRGAAGGLPLRQPSAASVLRILSGQ